MSRAEAVPGGSPIGCRISLVGFGRWSPCRGSRALVSTVIEESKLGLWSNRFRHGPKVDADGPASTSRECMI